MNTWWEANLPKQMNLFRHWVGDHTVLSKRTARQHAIAQNYESVLDVGCGPATEATGYANDAPHIQYRGVDSCKSLVESLNREDVVWGRADDLPFPDRSYDMVFIRHVLEHLPHYGQAMIEACRVARREVVIVFFIPLANLQQDRIEFRVGDNYYLNRYSYITFKKIVHAIPRVRGIRDQFIGKELMVHVVMEDPK